MRWSWFNKLWERFPVKGKVGPVRYRTYRNGDSLTSDEVQYIDDKTRCPDCMNGWLLEGPSGGMSTNYMCSRCGSKFNICPGVMYQRISDSSEIGELWDSYRELINMKEDL